MRRLWLAFGFAAVTSVASPVLAICDYKGVLNARTSIRQEFADSKWVVRARVLSARDGVFRPNTEDETLWTTYTLRVVHAYKGIPPNTLKFFTERNSGGFYMDRPWVSLPAGHDVGGEYLLFLTPNPLAKAYAVAKNSVFVNYTCGQSRPWREVPKSSRQLLERLSKHHRPRT
jgi:hypothetical protein